MFKKGLILATIFLLIGVFTLSDYGPNVDEHNHFTRGQALLHYLLTGEKDYADLPPEILHRGLVSDEVVKVENGNQRSIYQSTGQDMNYFLAEKNHGHPGSNDLLAALSNFIFFQKLKVLGDLEAHHLFSLTTGALLVGLVFIFGRQAYGGVAGLVAALALATYPLFLGESRFNVKDPPETFFYAATLWSFWRGVKEKKARYFLLAAFFFAWGMGTKFNIFFLAFSLLPWLVMVFWKNIRHLSFKLPPRNIILAWLAAPVIIAAIFLFTNPFLWPDPVGEFLKMINYYRNIGGFTGGRTTQPAFLWHNFNFYPFSTVLYTTPLITLGLALVGAVVAMWRQRLEKDKISLLVLLWFLVPILRVTLPPASIYGGLRQIMEYVPAMAILAGLGAESLRKKFPNFQFSILAILLFLPITLKMIQIHPNQDVYFNPLMGGLAGAAAKDYPYYGDNLGNVYLQGIKWLNQNAEPDARLALPIGNITNLPWTKIRPDIYFSNVLTSYVLREGEYAMDTEYQGKIQNYETWYYRNEVRPIYEVKVDGVSILNVWKNDPQSARPGLLDIVDDKPKLILEDSGRGVIFDFERLVVVERFSLDFKPFCKEDPDGRATKIFYSIDGLHWNVEGGSNWKFNGWATGFSPQARKILAEHDLVFLLAARKARFLEIELSQECLGKISNWEAKILGDFVNLSSLLSGDQLVFSGEVSQPGEYFLVSSGDTFNPFSFRIPFVQEPLFGVQDQFSQIDKPHQLEKGNFFLPIPLAERQNLLRPDYWSEPLSITAPPGTKNFVYQKAIPEFDQEAMYLVSFDYRLLKGEAAVGLWQPPYPDYPQKPLLLAKPSNFWQHHGFLLKPERGTTGLDLYLYALASNNKGAAVFFKNLSVQKLSPGILQGEIWLIKKDN